MSVYILAEISNITDDENYRKYSAKAKRIVSKHGGKYIFRSENLSPISGDWNIRRMILIEFENKEKMNECFQSEEYKEIIHLRTNSVESKAITIEE